MENLLPRALVNWTKTPIPGFSPSAGGLIALADLSTISRRTAIAGGSSWLDALLLAPGLHYQQAADAMTDGSPSSYSAIELLPGKTTLYSITNPAAIRYLQRVALAGPNAVVYVGPRPARRGAEGYRDSLKGRRLRPNARVSHESLSDIGWFSHVLYLMSPVLTAISLVFMVLLEDWWGVGLLMALMFSRILNIWVIKQRSKQPPPTSRSPHNETTHSQGPHSHRVSQNSTYSSNTTTTSSSLSDNEDYLTEYLVDLGQGRTVRLRGLTGDLRAVTTASWLTTKTHVQGYLEAAAKLTVYLVAAFSGNLSQAGSIIFMGLLLVTAGLLGLSNAHAKHLSMHGRVATFSTAPLSSSSASSSQKKQQQQQQFSTGGPAGDAWAYPASQQPLNDTYRTTPTTADSVGGGGAKFRRAYYSRSKNKPSYDSSPEYTCSPDSSRSRTRYSYSSGELQQDYDNGDVDDDLAEKGQLGGPTMRKAHG